MKPLRWAKYQVHGAATRLGWHAKPDFIGVGVEKAGTTSMYYYLMAHPDIRHPYGKELLFFNKHYAKGIDWYWSRFPLPLPGRKFLTGEFTPSYLFYPTAPERIAAHLPNVKLIVLLRNPVERAWSQHVMNRTRYGGAPLEDTFAAELELIAREGPDWYLLVEDAPAKMSTTYATRGFYARVLKRWFNYFPRENFLILKSEAFFAQPEATFMRTLRFIGADAAAYPKNATFPNHLPGGYTEPMPDDFRRQLHGLYREPNQELAELLGWDVSDWDQL